MNGKYFTTLRAKMEILAEKMTEEIFRDITPSLSTHHAHNNSSNDVSVGASTYDTLGTAVCETHWDRLPHEIWIKIFSYLTQAELYYNVKKVCKQWRIWSEDISLWKSVDFHEMHKDLETMSDYCESLPDAVGTDCFKCILSTFSRHIVSLKMSRFVSDCALGDVTLGFICGCKHLTVLDLGFSDEVDLQVISKSCFNLETLILEGCRSLRDNDFSSIVCLYKLRRLNVSHCAMLTDMFLVLLYGLKNLKALITDGVMHLTDLGLIRFFCKHPFIEELIIDGEELADETVRFAANNLPKLIVFETSFSQSLGASSMLAFNGKYKMKSLKFRKAPNFISPSIRQVFHPGSCYDLRNFMITESEHMDDESLACLAAACPNLESLTVDWCWKISDKGIEAVVNSCKKMKTLSFVGLFGIEGELWLDNLETRLPCLCFLDLSDCNEMPDEKLTDLVCRKPSLNVYSYFHEKVCLPTSVAYSLSSSDEEEYEYKCPGEVGVKVDF